MCTSEQTRFLHPDLLRCSDTNHSIYRYCHTVPTPTHDGHQPDTSDRLSGPSNTSADRMASPRQLICQSIPTNGPTYQTNGHHTPESRRRDTGLFIFFFFKILLREILGDCNAFVHFIILESLFINESYMYFPKCESTLEFALLSR